MTSRRPKCFGRLRGANRGTPVTALGAKLPPARRRGGPLPGSVDLTADGRLESKAAFNPGRHRLPETRSKTAPRCFFLGPTSQRASPPLPARPSSATAPRTTVRPDTGATLPMGLAAAACVVAACKSKMVTQRTQMSANEREESGVVGGGGTLVTGRARRAWSPEVACRSSAAGKTASMLPRSR